MKDKREKTEKGENYHTRKRIKEKNQEINEKGGEEAEKDYTETRTIENRRIKEQKEKNKKEGKRHMSENQRKTKNKREKRTRGEGKRNGNKTK